jgi:hypothetical protein
VKPELETAYENAVTLSRGATPKKRSRINGEVDSTLVPNNSTLMPNHSTIVPRCATPKKVSKINGEVDSTVVPRCGTPTNKYACMYIYLYKYT